MILRLACGAESDGAGGGVGWGHSPQDSHATNQLSWPPSAGPSHDQWPALTCSPWLDLSLTPARASLRSFVCWEEEEEEEGGGEPSLRSSARLLMMGLGVGGQAGGCF